MNWKYNPTYEIWLNMDHFSMIRVEGEKDMWVVWAAYASDDKMVLNMTNSEEEAKRWLNEWMKR